MPRKSNKRQWFGMEMKDSGEAEIQIYDAIGSGSWWGDEAVTARTFTKEFNVLLKKNPSVINVRLNSPGGEVSNGTAIANAIRKVSDKVVVHIDGLAASIASIIAIAGHKTVMADNALFMIHNPTTFAMGDASEMRKKADLLDKTRDSMVSAYAKKSEMEDADVEAAMDEETWYTAEEAKEAGFVDEVFEGAELTAAFDLNKWRGMYSHMPQFTMAGPVPNTQKEAKDMADETSYKPASPDPNAPVAAGFYDIKNALPDADNDFICAQQEARASVAQAQDAWQTELKARLDKAESEKAEAVAAAVKETEERLVKLPGVDALGDGGAGEPEGEGTAGEQWTRAIQDLVAKGKTRMQAAREIEVSNPGLREAYVKEHNDAIRASGKG